MPPSNEGCDFVLNIDVKGNIKHRNKQTKQVAGFYRMLQKEGLRGIRLERERERERERVPPPVSLCFCWLDKSSFPARVKSSRVVECQERDRGTGPWNYDWLVIGCNLARPRAPTQEVYENKVNCLFVCQGELYNLSALVSKQVFD